MPGPETQTEQAGLPKDSVKDYSQLRVLPTNSIKIHASSEDVCADLGLSAAGQSTVVHTRAMMSPYTAKRLCIALTSYVIGYEKLYGQIEIDPTKRLKDEIHVGDGNTPGPDD